MTMVWLCIKKCKNYTGIDDLGAGKVVSKYKRSSHNADM